MRPVAFLHAAEVHVATFRTLLTGMAPATADAHLVDAELLADARLRGIDAGIKTRLMGRLRELADYCPGVIVCTCSTLGGSGELLGKGGDVPVVRVARPMVEASVAIGGRVALVAALESTLAPTRQLFEEGASAAGRAAA